MAPTPTDGERVGDYLGAWSEISRSMESGVSWSGHERDCAWLNAGGGEFVEAALVAGFDSGADGRVVCRTDWDGDGDEDLWVRSRTGRSLRYLENQANPERFLSVETREPWTGVVATLTEGSEAPAREAIFPFAITDGYLAAPSRRVTLALPEGLHVTGLRAVGPKARGNAVMGPLEGHCALAEGAFAPAATRRRILPKSASTLKPSPLPTRTVLRTPLDLPKSLLAGLGVPPRGRVRASGEPGVTAARLLVVRAPNTQACESEIPTIDFLSEVELVAEGGDQVSQDGEGQAGLQALVQALLGPGTSIRLPVGILLGPGSLGRDQSEALTYGPDVAHVLYQGDINPETVRQDAAWFVDEAVQMSHRTTWGVPGAGSRWFHYSPRSYSSLERALRGAGAHRAAAEYAAIPPQSR